MANVPPGKRVNREHDSESNAPNQLVLEGTTDSWQKGYLPSGIPCKCATALQIQKCAKNAENYPVGSYDPLLRNCGDWVGKLAKECCLSPNYWIPGNRIWYGPTFGWTED